MRTLIRSFAGSVGVQARMVGLSVGLMVGLTVATSGCAVLWGLTHSPGIAECAGDLPSVAGLPSGMLIRDRVRVTSSKVDFGFDLILETSDDGLLLVGLNNLGTKAFVVHQRGTEVEAQNFLGPGLPFPPINVLRDVHRVHLLKNPDGGLRVKAEVGADQTVKPQGCAYQARFVTIAAQVPAS